MPSTRFATRPYIIKAILLRGTRTRRLSSVHRRSLVYLVGPSLLFSSYATVFPVLLTTPLSDFGKGPTKPDGAK